MARGIMEVLLVDAKGLEDTDFLGDIDPYVLIHYQNQVQKSSVAREQGKRPSWNEKFKFMADFPGGDDQHKLTLRVMDKDKFSSDDFLGQATIYLKDVVALGVENGTARLHPRKYRVVQADKTYRGEIRVGITFTPELQEQNEGKGFGGWKQH